MSKFEIEFSYTMTGKITVEAGNSLEAEEIIDQMATDRLGAEYLDDSFCFDKITKI